MNLRANDKSRYFAQPRTRTEDLLREPSAIIVLSFSYKIYSKAQQAFHTNLMNVQQSEQPLFTKLEAMRMLRVLFVTQPRF